MLRSLCLSLACAAALAAATAIPASAAPVATASKSCKAPKYPGSGYFTSLKVSKTGCRKGRKVALAHYRCRTEKGRTGRCARRVKGFRCTEKRNSIPTEMNSRTTCKRGAKRVVFTYQQNT